MIQGQDDLESKAGKLKTNREGVPVFILTLEGLLLKSSVFLQGKNDVLMCSLALGTKQHESRAGFCFVLGVPVS